MHGNNSPQFLTAFIQMIRELWDGEERGGVHNRSTSGFHGESLDEEAQILNETVALCSRDEGLNRRFLSTLREQPLLPRSNEQVRAEGLFTLVTLDEPMPEDDEGGDLFDDEEWSNVNGPWPQLDPARDALADATCGLLLMPLGAAWRATDIHLFSRLRNAGTALLIVCCLEQEDLVDQTLADYIFQQTGVRPLWVRLPEAEPVGRSGMEAEGFDAIVDWIAACSGALAVQLAQELPRFRRRLAERRIRDAALAAGILGAEPAPLIDVPLLLLMQRRMARQLAAMYAQPAPPLFSTEGAGIVTLGVGTRYLAQQLMKLIPFIGWILSALLSGASTWLLGMALLVRYEEQPIPDVQIILYRLRQVLSSLRWRFRRRRTGGCVPVQIPISYGLNGGDRCSDEHGPSTE